MRHFLGCLFLAVTLYICYLIEAHRWSNCSFSEGLWEMGFSAMLGLSAVILMIAVAWARLAERRRRMIAVMLLALGFQTGIMWYLIWGTKEVGFLLEKEEACVLITQLPESRWNLYIDVGFMYVGWVCFTVLDIVVVSCRQAVLMLCYVPQMNAFIEADVLRHQNVQEGLPQELIDQIAEVTGKENEVCSICLESYSPTQSVKQLPACNHQFHKNCIALWLLRSRICPFCKQQITEEAIRAHAGLQ